MKKLGFTLSEVLIALVIIGVLAAIVIPPMMNNTNEREFRTAAKKAISGLDRAIALEYALEGLTVQDYVSSEELVKYLFKKRMNNLEPSSKRFTNPDTCKDATPESIFNTTDGMIYCVTNFKSDYSDALLKIIQTDDGDIVLKISNPGEMRIATQGGKLHGEDLVSVINSFKNIIEVLNKREENI